jgi:hypothetical protein
MVSWFEIWVGEESNLRVQSVRTAAVEIMGDKQFWQANGVYLSRFLVSVLETHMYDYVPNFLSVCLVSVGV